VTAAGGPDRDETEAFPARRERLAVTVRPARPDDLAACAVIFRTAINAYTRPLGQIDVPEDPGPVTRLWAHTRLTDPERFVVATAASGGDGDGSERIVAFGSAVLREPLWFLSMLFVLPEAQGSGVGREILARILPADPATLRATATDSAQPISNALYALHDIVPRIPLLNLTGLPLRPEVFGPLPSGVTALPFDEIDGGPSAETDGVAGGALRGELDALDRELLGFTHAADHAWLRGEGRHGWLYRGPDGHAVGYGYAGEAGRVGPIAARDEALIAPILGHVTSAVMPRGVFSMWIGGPADRALVAALQAGFRLDGFPVLLCWDRPFADFTRYLPISPGLL
jgi:GNAT superfamily N-acetyltransferase